MWSSMSPLISSGVGGRIQTVAKLSASASTRASETTMSLGASDRPRFSAP
jgi:hypothetical protein